MQGWVSGRVCLYLSLLMCMYVIDGWGKRWRPPPRWSDWALSHCAMTAAAALPDPHHHIIDTKPTANLPLAHCLWHRLRWSCLDYHPLHNEDWTIMKRNTVSTNYKIKFVCLSLLSGWIIFSSFFLLFLKRGAQCCAGQCCGARVKWQTQGG